MALYLWIEQGILAIPEHRYELPSFPQFTYNPFPYLPPELIVSILSHAPADTIPSLYQTNHFFQLHIDIYKRQLIKIRCQRYPHQILSTYSAIHTIDLDAIYCTPSAWQTLSKFEQMANVCLTLESLLLPTVAVNKVVPSRFYRASLRQWESRRSMFFPKEQWQEALLDRFHIYEDCSRSEICDMIHLQMLYRNLLSRLPWSDILPEDITSDIRIHWASKSDQYRNIIDQIIGCGPDVILSLISSSKEVVIPLLKQFISLFESTDSRQLRLCCFDDVMAKLLTRLDGGNQAATCWQEEESYFDVCATTNWFCEGDVRVIPFQR